MTIDPNKLVGIPKMGAGEKLSAAAEIDKLCTPVAKPVIPATAATAHLGDPCIFCKTPHDDVAPGACPGAVHPITDAIPKVDLKPWTTPTRVVQPDPDFYWADDYGNIWRQAVEPVVILSVTSGCTIAELGTILAALLGSRG